MIKLGQKVQDKVTGFTGVATARIEYINGCVQYCVKPKVGADGKMVEGEYLDQQQLEVLSDEVKIKSSETGGLQLDCPKH